MGEGTVDSPYLINDIDELSWFAGLVNGTLSDGTAKNTSACAKLMNDITMNENVLTPEYDLNNTTEFTVWTPIGADDNSVYQGTFDGNQHTISGLYSSASNNYGGLFGVCQNAKLLNIVIVDSFINAKAERGGIAAKLTSCEVRGCYIEVATDVRDAINAMGAISGKTNYSNISSCVVVVTTHGDSTWLGVLCGSGEYNNFTNCFVSGAVTYSLGIYVFCCGQGNTRYNCWIDDYLSPGQELQDMQAELNTYNHGIYYIVGMLNHEMVTNNNIEFFNGYQLGDEAETMRWSVITKEIYTTQGVMERPLPVLASEEYLPVHRVTYEGIINEIKWTDVTGAVDIPTTDEKHKYTVDGVPFTASDIKKDTTVYVEYAYPAFVVETNVEDGYEYSTLGTLDITKPGNYTVRMNDIWEGSTSSNIIISANEGQVSLTLDGVLIDCSTTDYTAPINIAGNADVNVILAENSVNSIHSATFTAGIQKTNSPSAHLEIMGGGTLNIAGGGYGTAIGSGYPREFCLDSDVLTEEEKNCASNITISGGTINASSAGNGTVIGGANKCNARDIVISGGNLTLNADRRTCLGGGIGSGINNIKITGGTINATSSRGCAIIGNGSENNLEITGGVIYAKSATDVAAIGGGDVNNIKILGGVVLPEDTFERDPFGGFGDLFSLSGDSKEITVGSDSVVGSTGNDTIIIDNANVDARYFSVTPVNKKNEPLKMLCTYVFSSLPSTNINRILGLESTAWKNVATDSSSKLHLLSTKTSAPQIIASKAAVGTFKSDSNGVMESIASPAVSIIDNIAKVENINQSCKLIIVSYKGAMMSEIKMLPITEDFSMPLVDILGDLEGTDTVKAMLFEDLEGAYPLCQYAQIVL